MRSLRTVTIGALTLAVVGIAIWAFAGYFKNAGAVYPSEGCTSETTFHYTVTYILDPGQPPPTVWARIYKGGDQVGGDRMMWIQEVRDIEVDYEYTTTLDEAGNDYSFNFVGGGGQTNEELGPKVKDC